MKNIKSILSVVAVMFAMSFSTANAANGFVYDTKYDDNNVMVSKTVFEKSDEANTITPKLKYEYKYNDGGQLVEKIALRWNGNKNKWENYYHHSFAYNQIDNTITVEYAQWNKNKNNFSTKAETKTYSMEEAQKLMAEGSMFKANKSEVLANR